MNAFGPAAESSQGGTLTAWCNLCRAEGREFIIDADEETWVDTMASHSQREHPEHEAAIRQGETYVPVEVKP